MCGGNVEACKLVPSCNSRERSRAQKFAFASPVGVAPVLEVLHRICRGSLRQKQPGMEQAGLKTVCGFSGLQPGFPACQQQLLGAAYRVSARFCL
jgi:hypothetical protein